MSERNKVSWNIIEIKNKLKDFKSNRKATLKLLSLVSDNNKSISMGKQHVFYHFTVVHINNKYGNVCWICCNTKIGLNSIQNINVRSHSVNFIKCYNCKNKTLCFGCLRESSRCKLIHSRKISVWLCLLSQKFPKDIIRLITKKVK